MGRHFGSAHGPRTPTFVKGPSGPLPPVCALGGVLPLPCGGRVASSSRLQGRTQGWHLPQNCAHSTPVLTPEQSEKSILLPRGVCS